MRYMVDVTFNDKDGGRHDDPTQGPWTVTELQHYIKLIDELETGTDVSSIQIILVPKP